MGETTGALDKLNKAVAESKIGQYFKVKERNSTFTQEIRGGLVSFLTICYILAVNSGILADTGGTCVSEGGACPLGPGSLGDDDCQACLQTTRRSLISATAASCVIAHFLMGAVANLPLAIAPGMGLNAYFAYTVVGFMGTGRISYEQALVAVFVEGFIFIALSLLGVRTWLTSAMPRSLLLSVSAGIGLFLAFIGLQQSEGLGVVTYNSATLVTLGGCSVSDRAHMFTFPLDASGFGPVVDDACTVVNGTAALTTNWLPSGNYACASSGIMRSPTMWLGISGGMLMAILMALEFRGAMIIGILFVTFISWIHTPGNMAAYIGKYTSVPGAAARTEYFYKGVALPNTSATAGKLAWNGFSNGNFWLALITFLYVDFLDATGTFFAMANFLNLYIPNFVDMKTKRFDRQLVAYCVDGVSIVAGALLGTSPLTVYIESASGIREGARTGIAALTICLCFVVALFFNPLIAAIPPYATGPALILVGSMMMLNITKVDWANVQDAVPAFLTIAIMPLTYSIAYGVVAGVISYLWIMGIVFLYHLVHASLLPKSFSPTATAAGGGSAVKAAWHLTMHPPRQKGLLEDQAYPVDTQATLREMTFRHHEPLNKGVEEAAVQAEAAADVEAAPTK